MDDDIKDLSGVRLLKYLINNFDHVFCELKKYEKNFKHISVDWDQTPYLSNKYLEYRTRTSNIQKVTTVCPFTGFVGDEDLIKPMRCFLKNPDGLITYEDLL